MITFTHPGFLLLLAVVPPLVYLRHFWPGRGGRLSFSFTIWQKEVFRPAIHLTRFLIATGNVAFWTGIILLILALAGPELVKKEKIYLTRGIDIMFVLDESPSMAARDFAPGNRFEAARSVIKDFVEARDHDPVGLVSFGKDAVLRVPPTLDYPFFLSTLDSLKMMELGNGTAIGMGIAVAVLHLVHSSAREKVIILLTDGENNAGEITPLTSAAIAASLGIKIYTIGIGTNGDVPLEYTDPESERTFRGVYRGVYDKDLLSTIAGTTGGRFFPATSPGVLKNIISSINSVERIEKRSRIKIETRPVHREIILLGFLLVMYNFIVRKGILNEVV